MANTSRRSVLRTRALVIGGITVSIFVGVAVFGWVAGWQTADQYSTEDPASYVEEFVHVPSPVSSILRPP